VLTLASVQAAKTVALAQYAAANDADDVPSCLTNVALPQGLNVAVSINRITSVD
jgi:hypothetical protein